MTVSLAESNAFCQQLARSTGKNFYYSFLGLPRTLRREMCVLYAFMRATDDIGDDESRSLAERRTLLDNWKQSLADALQGQTGDHPILPALAELVASGKLPARYLFDVIEGVEMDLEPRRFATFSELETYCYHVAGAVGLCCIHVWGFDGDDALPPAIACGTAFQLTNILRDLAEDIDRDRVYLPQEDLQRFGYTEEDLQRRVFDDRFRRLMQFEVARARTHYQQAEQLFAHLAPPGQPILRAMIRIYGGLLDRIERRGYDIFSSRIHLSRCHKWSIVLKALLRV
jgi:15-cis-phytoene synthase